MRKKHFVNFCTVTLHSICDTNHRRKKYISETFFVKYAYESYKLRYILSINNKTIVKMSRKILIFGLYFAFVFSVNTRKFRVTRKNDKKNLAKYVFFNWIMVLSDSIQHYLSNEEPFFVRFKKKWFFLWSTFRKKWPVSSMSNIL